MFNLAIELPIDEIIAYCEQHPAIRKLSLFGSVLRDDFGPDSDVDVLVEFVPNSGMSLFDMGEIQMDLMDIVGHDVDLKTPGFLGQGILEDVMRTRVMVYERP
jgi:predicted nucleotidyltransferase